MIASTEDKPVWNGTPKSAMRAFLINDMYVAIEAARLGVEVNAVKAVDAMLDQLDKIARESYPLYQMRQDADLVLRAEGPGAAGNMQWQTIEAAKEKDKSERRFCRRNDFTHR